jgi:hypothetical protein
MKKLSAIAIGTLVLFLSGCPKIEQDAYNVVIAAKGFTDSIKVQHPECATGAKSTVCADLAKAIAAKDLIIDAVEVYCSGPNFNAKGSCDAPAKGTPTYTQAVAKINAAIASYNQTSTDLKGVL